jgi:diketogulonate reductase-like aldo/keto reductase
MPMLAYGTGTAWYKTGEESKIDQGVIDGVKMAIKLGYTHLDGAESKLYCPPAHPQCPPNLGAQSHQHKQLLVISTKISLRY